LDEIGAMAKGGARGRVASSPDDVPHIHRTTRAARYDGAGMRMDPRAILGAPVVFRTFKRLITRAGPGELVRRHVRPWPGARILDIGCGLGAIVEQLPAVGYDGFDLDPNYIESARRTYGDRGTFHCADVTRAEVRAGAYDIVMAIGVLHHLDDREAGVLVDLAWRALVPGGRLVTFDGCYQPRQSRVARYLLARDRGRHVRDEGGYVRLVRARFDRVEVAIRHDWLRIPYTHIIIEATKQERAAA
jgi:SAM-dependent methyltransferase